MSRSTLRGCKDGGQFVRLLKESLGFRHGKNSRFSHQFQPQNCFVCFFNYYPNLRDKFRFRPGPANSPVVSRDRSAASQKLLSHHLSIRFIRQRLAEPDHSQSECLRPISQLLRLTAHRTAFKSHNHTMARSLNSSSVDFSEHDVNRADCRHYIRQQSPFAHFRQRLQIRKTCAAHVHAVGLGGSVADYVIAHLPAR
jgi:hypothetical protein